MGKGRFVAEQVGKNLWYIHDSMEGRKLDMEIFTEREAKRIVRALNITLLTQGDA